MAGAGIVVEGVHKTYRRGNVKALRGVSLAVEPGETLGVIGPNGAGKTTLMGCLLGFLHADAGRIEVDGAAPDDLAVRAASGYLPERLNFDRWMTGRDFLAHHHALARQPAAGRDRDVEETLESVGLERSAWTQVLAQYSRGMLQRLGFAQAVIGRPRILFLDEPTSGMDPVGVVMIRGVLDRLKQEGVTIVLNSHQLEQVERFCDRVAYVRAGQVESVEVLTAGAATRRVLRIRVAGESPAERQLVAAAAKAGAEWLGAAASWLRFAVDSDEAAATLVRTLVQAGIPVMEVTPEVGRLERLFFTPPGAGA